MSPSALLSWVDPIKFFMCDWQDVKMQLQTTTVTYLSLSPSPPPPRSFSLSPFLSLSLSTSLSVFPSLSLSPLCVPISLSLCLPYSRRILLISNILEPKTQCRNVSLEMGKEFSSKMINHSEPRIKNVFLEDHKLFVTCRSPLGAEEKPSWLDFHKAMTVFSKESEGVCVCVAGVGGGGSKTEELFLIFVVAFFESWFAESYMALLIYSLAGVQIKINRFIGTCMLSTTTTLIIIIHNL